MENTRREKLEERIKESESTRKVRLRCFEADENKGENKEGERRWKRKVMEARIGSDHKSDIRRI